MTHLLIVDDQVESLRFLHTLLTSKGGYHVTSARNGQEALQAALNDPPDLVISDLLMPVMDGYTLLRHWKTDAALKSIPFIVHSGTFTETEDEHLVMSMGAEAFILKPAKIQTFLAKVKAVLAAGASTSPVESKPVIGEDEALKYYSERLVHKLEERSVKLEETNKALQQEISERRQAEAATSFHNTILQTQQKASLSGILIVSEEGLILSYNEKFLELWNLSEEAFAAARLTPMIQHAPMLQAVEQNVVDPKAYLTRIRYLHQHRDQKSLEEIHLKDGRVFERYSAPAVDTNGRYYGRVWDFRDVTESRRAQVKLEKSEREQRQLAESLRETAEQLSNAQRLGRIASWSMDVRSGHITWATAACELCGVTPAEFDGSHMQFRSFVLPQDLSVFDAGHQQLSVTQPQLEMEYRIRRPDGGIRWLYARGNVEFDADSNAVSRAGMVMDITEQKAAADEIHGLGNRLIETLETISDAFITFDHDWNFTYINVQAEQLLQRNRSTLLGRNLWIEYSDIVGTMFHEKYVEAATQKVAVEFEQFYPALNVWFEVNAYPANEGLAVYFRDITERKQTEAKLAYLNRVRAVLSEINALIVRAKDRKELFKEACSIAYKSGGFRMVMLCVVNPQTKVIEPVVAEGNDEELMTKVRTMLSSTEVVNQTMVAQAIRSNQAMVSNDARQDPQLIRTAKYHAAGVGSIAVLPLSVQNEAFGAFALYASEIDVFQNDEMVLLSELANDISFAVDHIDKLERLNYLANFDTLTGLANRDLFLQKVRLCLEEAAREKHGLAVCMINIERFKNINDTMGRAVGDSLLRQVAEWLIRNAGDKEAVSRVGADQFAVVLTRIDAGRDLVKLFENLSREFQENLFQLNDTTLRIASKAGTAVYPDDGADAETLFRNAEAALKQARISNERFMFYTGKMNNAIAEKVLLETRLRQALDNEEFTLLYQPKINLASGKVQGAEALIRWNDPRNGVVFPGVFIPVLEETGLIYDVGRWALRKAIDDYLRWRKAGLPAVRIAVNVSSLQLTNRNFVSEICSIVSVDQHAAEGIELELTESMLMENIHHVTDSLQAIRELGITIAIDDFGTGFSSLGYLTKLPVDRLKIDRSFIVAMAEGPRGMALVSTIISLAHALDLTVIAEGVETDDQKNLLRLLSCDEIQGYAFSAPVPAADFEAKYLLPPRK